jgi:hypothetical protein
MRYRLMFMQIEKEYTLMWENTTFLPSVVPICSLLEQISRNVKSKNITQLMVITWQ